MHFLKLASIPLLASLAAAATIQVSTQAPSLDSCWQASQNIDELLSQYAQYGDSWMGSSRDAIGHILQSIAESATTIKQNCEKLQTIGNEQTYQDAEQKAGDLFGRV